MFFCFVPFDCWFWFVSRLASLALLVVYVDGGVCERAVLGP